MFGCNREEKEEDEEREREREREKARERERERNIRENQKKRVINRGELNEIFVLV